MLGTGSEHLSASMFYQPESSHQQGAAPLICPMPPICPRALCALDLQIAKGYGFPTAIRFAVHLQPPPPSAYTQPYTAEGFFTGVRSSITIRRSPGLVYDSLSKDLHKIFGPITVRRLHYNLPFCCCTRRAGPFASPQLLVPLKAK